MLGAFSANFIICPTGRENVPVADFSEFQIMRYLNIYMEFEEELLFFTCSEISKTDCMDSFLADGSFYDYDDCGAGILNTDSTLLLDVLAAVLSSFVSWLSLGSSGGRSSHARLQAVPREVFGQEGSCGRGG